MLVLGNGQIRLRMGVAPHVRARLIGRNRHASAESPWLCQLVRANRRTTITDENERSLTRTHCLWRGTTIFGRSLRSTIATAEGAPIKTGVFTCFDPRYATANAGCCTARPARPGRSSRKRVCSCVPALLARRCDGTSFAWRNDEQLQGRLWARVTYNALLQANSVWCRRHFQGSR